MQAGKKVLLFGGSFNPVHHGHLVVARHVAERLEAERVILIPSARPPHKDVARLAAAEHRLAMCRLAVAGDALFEVSDYELQPSEGPNFTLPTVEHFRGQLGEAATLYWLIGMDTLNELPKWHKPQVLVERCTIVTAARPGAQVPEDGLLQRCFSAAQVAELRAHVLDSPEIEISSTQVRERVRRGASIRYLAPPEVCTYIAQHELYRG